MKKHLLNHWYCKPVIFSFFAAILILFSGTLQAQITITSGDFPHAGMLVFTNIDSTPAISTGRPRPGP